IPATAQHLSFTVSFLGFDSLFLQGVTPDAFGVALLDPPTWAPLVATVDSFTDSFYTRDLEQDVTEGLAAAGVVVTPGLTPGTWHITLDLGNLGGHAALLAFRLIGGSDGSQLGASVAISDVVVGN